MNPAAPVIMYFTSGAGPSASLATRLAQIHHELICEHQRQGRPDGALPPPLADAISKADAAERHAGGKRHRPGWLGKDISQRARGFSGQPMVVAERRENDRETEDPQRVDRNVDPID